jgi:hypothetical protein
MTSLRSAIALLIATTACAGSSGAPAPSSDGGGATDAGTWPVAAPAERDACAAFAQAFCARLEACAPLSLADVYGDTATCGATERRRCEGIAALPDSGDAAAIAAAAGAVATQTCGQVARWHNPLFGSWAGARATGQACLRPEQCASSFCTNGPDGFDPKSPPSGGCGVCRDRDVLGSHCQVYRSPKLGPGVPMGPIHSCLDPDLTCDVDSERCVPTPRAGDTCWGECEYGLTCNASTCGPQLPAGAACDPDRSSVCDHRARLVCPVSTRTCQFLAVLKAGEPCGGVRSAGACASGFTCIPLSQLDASTDDDPGTCRTQGGLGAACDEQKPCLWSLGCHGGACQPELFTSCGTAALGR